MISLCVMKKSPNTYTITTSDMAHKLRSEYNHSAYPSLLAEARLQNQGLDQYKLMQDQLLAAGNRPGSGALLHGALGILGGLGASADRAFGDYLVQQSEPCNWKQKRMSW